MARQSSKHAQVAAYSYPFTGGLNLADSPTNVADGQLTDVRNFWYPPGGTALEVRPGLEYIADPPASNASMTNLHAYQKGGTTSYVVASFDDGTCRYLSGASWTQFHTLGSPGVTPPLLTFHDKLIIGDITTNLKAWDGSTVSTLAGSPKASALAEVGGRVVANSADDLDAVVYSVPQDETNWLIASGAGFARIGYGDGQAVIGFVPYSSDLAVFKAGADGGRIRRLVNAVSDESAWAVPPRPLAEGLVLTSPQAVAFVGNNVLFGSQSGAYDLAGVQEYGEIKVGVAGRNVNSVLSTKTIRNISYLPQYGVALVFLENDYRVYVYHSHSGEWTMFDFAQKRLVGAVTLGDQIYIGAEDGTLYRLTSGESRDEMSSGVFTDIVALARGKQIVMRGEAISKRARLHYAQLSASTIELNAIAPDGITRTNMLTINGVLGAGMLYDADAPLSDATQKLYASSTWYRTGRSRIREQSLTAEVRSTAGRYCIHQADFELAQVNG